MVSGVTNPETSGSSGLDPRQRCGTAIADPLPPYENLQNEAERSQNVL